MFRRSLLTLLLVLCPQILGADQSLLAKVQELQDSLVEIRTVYERTLKTKNGRMGVVSYERHGTGIVLDASGIIVTNTHIIAQAPKILVGLSNGQVYEANVLYASEADFSFLKIDAALPLKPIQWAESSLVNLGDRVIALGNSEYNQQSILGGQVSRLLQSKSTGHIEMLEVDINLFKGDSGGPVLDHQGRLLGLIMAKQLKEDRRSYAIASDKIRYEYLKLKQKLP